MPSAALIAALLLAAPASADGDRPIAWEATSGAAAEGPSRPARPGRDLGHPRPDGLAEGCSDTACLAGALFADEIESVLEAHGLTVERLDGARIAAGDLALCDSLYVTRSGRHEVVDHVPAVLDWAAAGGVVITEFNATSELFAPPWSLFSGTLVESFHLPSGERCGNNTVRVVDRCSGLANGLPDEWDCSGDPIGVMVVMDALDPEELRVVAVVAGSDANGDGADDPLLASAPYGDGGFVLFFSDFADFRLLADPRPSCVSCNRTHEDEALLVNAACRRLFDAGFAATTLVGACEGEDVVLDISEETIPGCDSTLERWWVDDPDAPLARTVPPEDGAVHEAVVDCAELDCSNVLRYEIRVVEHPPAPAPTAWSRPECESGVHLEWEPVAFPGAEGGIYNVYRSESSCDDALLSPPLVTGLELDGWFDAGAELGVEYHYVVEAESHGPSSPCEPIGGAHGGPAARGCSGPVTNVGEGEWPAGVFATLRLSHDGDEVTLDWSAARPLLPGEHFHVKKAVGTPPSDFDLVSPEPLADRQWSETDLTPGPHFFDLRVANPCETESEDEYPPSR